MTQYGVILSALVENPDKVFIASDFQSGKYFVGYEATARMSELCNLYPDLIIVGKVKKFRSIRLNKKCTRIEEIMQRYISNEETNE